MLSAKLYNCQKKQYKLITLKIVQYSAVRVTQYLKPILYNVASAKMCSSTRVKSFEINPLFRVTNGI